MEPFSSISNAWVPFSLFSRDTFRKTKTPESWHSPKEVWKISSWLYLPEFSRCFNIGILFSSILTTIQRKHVIQTLLFLTANDCGASYNRNTRSSLRMQRQSTTNYQRFSQFFRVFKRGTPLMATMAPINRFFFLPWTTVLQRPGSQNDCPSLFREMAVSSDKTCTIIR